MLYKNRKGKMYCVEIRSGKKKTYFHRKELKEKMFLFNKTGKHSGKWVREFENKGNAENIAKYFTKKGLKVLCFDKINERTNTYRNEFFGTYAPQICGHYICSYCSRVLTKDKVSVDHIIPIDVAKKNKFWQWLIRKLKWESVNDKRNLTASCTRCNRKKSSKTGLWIIRGFLGRYILYWKVVYLLIIAVLFVLFLLYIKNN